MAKIIINADDCGYSQHVNQHIEHAIVKGRISSTTIMANMNDYEGALRLYNQYAGSVSFGFHINLTEGSPLRKSQLLIDTGFYQEKEGNVIFNAQPFRRKYLAKSVREEIYKEVMAQATRLRDSGVKISHIDGHHFIHQSVFMFPILPRLCKTIGVHKIRTYRNYMPLTINRVLRDRWKDIIRMQDGKAVFTDWFTSFEDFCRYGEDNKTFYKSGDVVELMCHPGGRNEREESLLLNTDVEKLFDSKLINYNTI